MDLLLLLQQNNALFISLVTLIGLMIGSFLNVVAYRLPLIMEREWKSQCHEILELPSAEGEASFTLSRPRSACPKCNHPISSMGEYPNLQLSRVARSLLRLRHCHIPTLPHSGTDNRSPLPGRRLALWLQLAVRRGPTPDLGADRSHSDRF